MLYIRSYENQKFDLDIMHFSIKTM